MEENSKENFKSGIDLNVNSRKLGCETNPIKDKKMFGANTDLNKMPAFTPKKIKNIEINPQANDNMRLPSTPIKSIQNINSYSPSNMNDDTPKSSPVKIDLNNKLHQFANNDSNTIISNNIEENSSMTKSLDKDNNITNLINENPKLQKLDMTKVREAEERKRLTRELEKHVSMSSYNSKDTPIQITNSNLGGVVIGNNHDKNNNTMANEKLKPQKYDMSRVKSDVEWWDKVTREINKSIDMQSCDSTNKQLENEENEKEEEIEYIPPKIYENNLTNEIFCDLFGEFKYVPRFPSVRAYRDGRIRYPSGRFCQGKPAENNGGYIICVVTNDKGRTINIAAHILMALAWLPNPENKPCVDHINGIKNDNNIGNLRWATKEENNNNHVFPQKEKIGRKVIQWNSSKTNIIAIYDSLTKAWEKTKIHTGNICKACRGNGSGKEKNMAGGFVWEYYVEKYDGEMWFPIILDNVEIEVSNFGRLRYMKDETPILGTTNRGYVCVKIREIQYMVHRLICFALHPIDVNHELYCYLINAYHPINGKHTYDNYKNLEVNHRDKNRSNNHESNLEWVTHQQNMDHERKKGTLGVKVDRLTLDGKYIDTFVSFNEAGRAVDGSDVGVRYACYHGNSYKDYKWRLHMPQVNF